MNTSVQYIVLNAILLVVLTGVACPATLWMIKFIRVKIATLFAIYTQTEDAGAQKWFYDQPATLLDGLHVEWKWILIPQFFWNQEKDTTPWINKFIDVWKVSGTKWWSLKRLYKSLLTAFRDSRKPVPYISEWELVPKNENKGIVFGDKYILVRRSAWGSIIGALVSSLVLAVAFVIVLLIVQSTISNMSATATPATKVFRTTAVVLSTRTIAEATQQAQITATKTPSPLVTLGPCLNCTPSPSASPTPGSSPVPQSTPAPTAPSTGNSPIGLLILIAFVITGGIVGYIIGFNQGKKQQ